MRLAFGHALLASALGHAALMAVWTAPPVREAVVPPRLQVALQLPAAAGRDSRARLTNAAASATRHGTAEREHAVPEEAAKAPAAPPAPASPSKPASATRSSRAPGGSARDARTSAAAPAPAPASEGPAATPRPLILARLHAALRARFSYPPLARRHGWEGEVLVGLRIEHGGRIDAVHVARSSGYGVLDRSAVDALRRVGGLPGVETGGRTLEMQIPVIYRLREG